MAKKRKGPQETLWELTEELISEYGRWNEVYEHGTNDPTWADGVNLNLVRNHILYWKRKIEELCDAFKLPLPEAYFEATPNEVNDDYIARKEEIKQNAIQALEFLSADEDYLALWKERAEIGAKLRKEICIDAVIGYVSGLERAIERNDYVWMRRFENPESYRSSFSSCLKQARALKPETFQLSLFDVGG